MIALVGVIAGFLVILGGPSLLGRAKGFLAGLLVVLLLAPVVLEGLTHGIVAFKTASKGVGEVVPAWLLPILLVGYLAAAVILVRRRSPDVARRREREASDRERARSRERPRLPPRGEEL